MTDAEYLTAILLEHSLAPGSPELTELQKNGDEVKGFLRSRFPGVRVNEAGSKRKGTMIRDSYDLDLTCYFSHDDGQAGDDLEEIYESVEAVLEERYHVLRKRSALRLTGLSSETDLHIDVVPGRFVDGSAGDVFLHQTFGDKERLKTNLDIHVEHVRSSAVRDAIKLMKVWREVNHIGVKTFVLELLVIDLLKHRTNDSLNDQLMFLWQELKERADTILVQDPANPSGNDLSDLLNGNIRKRISICASTTLDMVADCGIQGVFGQSKGSKSSDVQALRKAAGTSSESARPWADG